MTLLSHLFFIWLMFSAMFGLIAVACGLRALYCKWAKPWQVAAVTALVFLLGPISAAIYFFGGMLDFYYNAFGAEEKDRQERFYDE